METLQQHLANSNIHKECPLQDEPRVNDRGGFTGTTVAETNQLPEESRRTEIATVIEKERSPEKFLENDVAPMIGRRQSPKGLQWTDIAEPRYRIELSSLVGKIHGRKITKKLYTPPENSHSPEPREGTPKIRAVALDCEMVATNSNLSELVRLTAIDYLTSEVLIDALVKPKETVINWRSTITGITEATMASAEAQGNVLYGCQGAQEELWKYVDSNTVLVGHAILNDLKALKIIHPKVVDSGILVSQAVKSKQRQFALEKLCKEILVKPIRQRPNATHDSLEDAFAARELVLWCLHNEEALRQWAKRKKKAIKAKNTRRRSKQKQKKPTSNPIAKVRELDESTDEDREILRWEDFAEDLGWPHPDTGYDPWSGLFF